MARVEVHTDVRLRSRQCTTLSRPCAQNTEEGVQNPLPETPCLEISRNHSGSARFKGELVAAIQAPFGWFGGIM